MTIQLLNGLGIAWILIVIIATLVLLRRSVKHAVNPDREQTLGLPKGYFRVIITLTSLFMFIIMAINHRMFSEELLKEIGKIVMVVVSFYFSNSMLKRFKK
jgi:hypothetical protein